MTRSRFLGYGGKRGQVFFDKDRPFSAEPLEPGVELVTQEYGKITKLWLRLNPGSEQEEMIPFIVGLDAPMTVELLRAFLAEWPPRSIMPVPDGGPTLRMTIQGKAKNRGEYSIEEIDSTPLGEEVFGGLVIIRFVVRQFLTGLWSLRHKFTNVRDAGFWGAMIPCVVGAIGSSCLGRPETPALPSSADPASEPDRLTQEQEHDVQQLAGIFRMARAYRGPVWMRPLVHNKHDLSPSFLRGYKKVQ